MEGIRNVDEVGAARAAAAPAESTRKRKVLVIDDSLMLLNFVKDMLREANYEVATASSGAEGLRAARTGAPALILLDYVLPDMTGDEALEKLSDDAVTAKIPVIYMSGLDSDLRPDNSNVIGFLNKPFTSDLLIKTVETHMPNSPDDPQPVSDSHEGTATTATEPEISEPAFDAPEGIMEPLPEAAAQAPAEPEEWWTAPQASPEWPQAQKAFAEEDHTVGDSPDWQDNTPVAESVSENEADLPNESVTGGAFFCGDTRFFSLNWALQTVAKLKLTGTLRSFWNKEPVELLIQNGQLVFVTTRDSELYCSESPITLVDVDPERISAARAQQRETGIPMFLALADENLILREPAVQLVQHYGQKLFAQLWTAKRVRFVFEQSAELPAYAHDIPPEGDVDNWTLATLRATQFQDLGAHASYDIASIPAYTKDGFARIQNLRLTVAEAQFASQFNGSRSIAQIAKNLRLDLKFAHLTLFCFLALEIVECWPATATAKTERKGFLQRLGIGE